jgi:membrane associated rhomboid family serine protease
LGTSNQRTGLTIATTCFHHTDRETGRSCTRCGRPACTECLTDAPVGSHCWQCIKAAQPPRRERIRRWNATAGALATKVIIGLNVGVYVLTAAGATAGRRGSELQTRLAVAGPAVAHGDWYRLLTSGFVHYGILHLAFNMLLLYRFGLMLEPALGRIRFVALYVVALLAGSFGAILLTPNALTGGASGAVFGLVGATAVGMRQRGISVWQTGVGGLLVVNLLITFTVPNISVGGHLGGLTAGAALGAFMLRERPSRKTIVEGVAVALAFACLAVAGAVSAAHR